MSLPALLERLDGRPHAARADDDDLARTIVLAERVSRRLRLGPDTCLYRGLARYATARAAGRDARFVMGVDPDDATTGHAWIEVDGLAVLEDAAARYLRTLEHPPRRRSEAVPDVREK